MRTLPYREGTWFSVPLRDGGYAVGLVARMAPRGRVLAGYFFGPKRNEVPSLNDVNALRPDGAVLVQRFGDLYLVEDKWPIVGVSRTWRRESWPMPTFGRYVEMDGTAWSVTYLQDNPNSVPKEVRVSPKDAKRLPKDGLLGAGAVEAVLTKLLGGPAPRRQERTGPGTVWHYLYFKDEERARRVAGQLPYRTDLLDSDGQWLVRVNHETLESERALTAVGDFLADLATAEGGRYDGWEREV